MPAVLSMGPQLTAERPKRRPRSVSVSQLTWDSIRPSSDDLMLTRGKKCATCQQGFAALPNIFKKTSLFSHRWRAPAIAPISVKTPRGSRSGAGLCGRSGSGGSKTDLPLQALVQPIGLHQGHAIHLAKELGAVAGEAAPDRLIFSLRCSSACCWFHQLRPRPGFTAAGEPHLAAQQGLAAPAPPGV